MLVQLSLTALIFVVSTHAQTTCNSTDPCPSATPCCSPYGFCGTDSFCLGGCNPLASHTLTSCRPEPVCQDKTYNITDTSRIVNATLYDGNSTAYDWTLDQGDVSNDGDLVLTLTQANGGTKLSSTNYVHYANITAEFYAGDWPGVVVAFITMSDIKDEIDWEFPGNQTTQGQTNYFWQGYVPTQTNGNTTNGITDNFVNSHSYTIDWQPNALTFFVDGQVVRTVNQADTVSNGVSYYPNTPSRVQLSIWPAGINTSSPGVVAWAGGMINWQDPDYLSAGHFYMRVKSLSIQCSDTTSRPSNATSYVYGGNATAFTPQISFSNTSTLINAASPSALAMGGGVFGLGSVVLAVSVMLLGHVL